MGLPYAPKSLLSLSRQKYNRHSFRADEYCVNYAKFSVNTANLWKTVVPSKNISFEERCFFLHLQRVSDNALFHRYPLDHWSVTQVRVIAVVSE